ncbi:hypothetical protein P9578_03625 [Brevibacillus choshinensis]|uniref:hypothetical protein n=1 Tax=Brevibacillus choshinensis TaxID=54911 RepID=UPI002E1DD36F|nr:hypothetical protein [Brevibacillus choshinensis]
MKSKVYMINHQRGWTALLTECNTFSIVEVLENTMPELGDIISGEIESLGGETLYNETKKETLEVFIQDIYADRSEALRQLNIHNGNKTQWEIL